MWHPEAPAIAALRQTIDQNPQRLKDVLKRDDVRQELLNGVVEDEAVQAFVTSPANKETALKTKPKVSPSACSCCFHWLDGSRAPGTTANDAAAIHIADTTTYVTRLPRGGVASIIDAPRRVVMPCIKI